MEKQEQPRPCPVCGTEAKYNEYFLTVYCPHCGNQLHMSLKDWESFPTEDQLPNACPACQQKPHAVLSNDMYKGKVQFRLSCEDHSTPWCENPQWAIIQWNLVTPAANQWQPTIQQLAEYGISVKPVEHDDRQ